jgi:hypothetical protein
MLNTIVVGTIVNIPTEKTDLGGRSWTQCRLRVATEGADPSAYLSAFDQAAQRALRPLGPGDMVALAGTVRFVIWPASDGQPPLVSAFVSAHKIFWTYELQRKRAATRFRFSGPA